MQRFTLFAAFLASLSIPVTALAHPGHGTQELGNGPLHYLLDPFHAAWTVGILAALLLASPAGRRLAAPPVARLLRRRPARR